MTESPKFDFTILLLILMCSVLLAIDNPLNNPNGTLHDVLMKLDYFMTAAFTIEATLKIVASGFLFNGKKSYIRNPWNILDFLIVIFSIVGLYFGSNSKLKVVKVLRLLRVLRPLRVISRN